MKRVISLATTATACALATSAMAAPKNLTAESGPAQTVTGQTMLALGEVASSAGIANIQTATGQTLTNTVQNVAEGKTDIGSAPTILTFLMSKGAGPYAKLGKKKGAELAGNLAFLYTYRFGAFGLFAYNSKKFGGWDAVKGATIYNGPPRGAALNRARALIKLSRGLNEGKGYKGIQVNWGQAVKTITDGSADANILPLNFPDPRLAQAAASGAITVWSMPKGKFEGPAAQKYMKAPGSIGVVEPKAGLFGKNIKVVSSDDKFRAIGEVGGQIVNKKMSFGLAKSLTKAFLENLDVVHSKSPFMKKAYIGAIDLKKTGLCGAVSVKYHPGAAAAWEEAGYKLPACAKP